MDVLTGVVTPGRRVAVIGAGGIGFDVADFLTHDYAAHNSAPNFDSVNDDTVSVLAPKIDKVVSIYFDFFRFAPGSLLLGSAIVSNSIVMSDDIIFFNIQVVVNNFLHTWGIDENITAPGGLLKNAVEENVPREVSV